MFDFDGDGDIDAYDEELTEYELQMTEDEIIFREMERRGERRNRQKDWGKSCGLGILIAIGTFHILAVVFLWLM